MSRSMFLVVFLTMFGVYPGLLHAQFSAAPTAPVTGSATATLSLKATRMRMVVDIISRDKDLKEAARKVMDRAKTAKEDLLALEAIEESITLGRLRIDARQSEANERMRMQLMEGFGQAGRGGNDAAPDALITVSARMSADWDLGGLDEVEMLTKTHELKQTLEAANLSGAEDNSSLSPEEQELFEEAQMLNNRYGGNDEKPGTAKFIFLADVSQDTLDALMKDAFTKAKSKAVSLANAANGQLGELTTITSTLGGRYDPYDAYGGYGGSNLKSLLDKTIDTDRTAIGSNPNDLTLTVRITAGFELITE